METKTLKRMVTIQGDTPQEYNNKYNEFMDNLDGVVTIFQRLVGVWCFIVRNVGGTDTVC